jgi:hypothetical protein
MRRVCSRALALAVAALALPAPAEAGVVVLNNGEVLVGRIRPNEDGPRGLTLRWPYRENTTLGQVEVRKTQPGAEPRPGEIRWYSREADEPTDDYWERFHRLPIDPAYHAARDRWRERQLPPPPPPRARLDPIPIETGQFLVRKPEGWSASLQPDPDSEEEVLLLRAPSNDSPGWVRVESHVRAPGDKTDEDLAAAVLEDLADRLEGRVLRSDDPLPAAGGLDVQHRILGAEGDDRWIFAVWIHVRPERTYLVVARAAERDFEALAPTFTLVAQSLQLHEDE